MYVRPVSVMDGTIGGFAIPTEVCVQHCYEGVRVCMCVCVSV